MGDIKRLGSGFALSSSSPIFRGSLSMPKMTVGQIDMPSISQKQVLGNIDSQQMAVAQAIDQSVRSVSQAFQSSSQFSIKTADGRSVPAARFLSPDELKQLDRLPPHLQRKILDVSSVRGSNNSQIQAELSKNIKAVIADLAEANELTFTGKDGRDWTVRNLLDLANAVNQMPISHRQQLEGVTFVRDDEPDFGYKDHAPDLLEKMANKMVAGHYDLRTRAVILYDRGLQDSFPVLDADLQQNLRAISAHSCDSCSSPKLDGELQQSLNALQGKASTKDVASLQKLLNPYLVRINQAKIQENGQWGPATETAVRSVQAHLLDKYLQNNFRLNPAQKQELQQLQQLATSPQFGMITRVVSLKDKMQNLSQIPDPQVQKLLAELAKSEFGDVSTQFLLRDISDASRSNRHVTRTEEVMIHEMGHHIQMGLSNENEYIAEFSKLSGWVKRESGEIADGYVNGMMSSENVADVYNQLASNGQQKDEGLYTPKLSPQERNQVFVTSYAATDPMEDFAESYKTFVLDPAGLIEASPEKFFFINSLPTIQNYKVGSGIRQRSHYTEEQIRPFVTTALRNQYRFEPSKVNVDTFIREHFENIVGASRSKRPLNLSSDTILAVLDTHKELLKSLNLEHLSPPTRAGARDPDFAVLQEIHTRTQNLIAAKGNAGEARDFFYSFTNPNEIENRFPKASQDLKTNLKDQSFAAMMLAMGKIGGYAAVINQAKNVDFQDQQTYKDAKDYFSTAFKQPSALLSRQVLTQGYNLLRGVSSNWVNPEDRKIDPARAFFQTLEADPAEAFPEGWYLFPEEFKEMLQNKRFLQAVSGDSGRYQPSPEVIHQTLEKIVEMIEFKRGLDAMLSGG
ncbi:MAG: hypothetical protein IV090_22900 [Candidatus Sericytochromatia bacterium]|nr:hypothetical protein [Candidatus Sericytochromatia bacterium]